VNVELNGSGQTVEKSAMDELYDLFEEFQIPKGGAVYPSQTVVTVRTENIASSKFNETYYGNDYTFTPFKGSLSVAIDEDKASEFEKQQVEGEHQGLEARASSTPEHAKPRAPGRKQPKVESAPVSVKTIRKASGLGRSTFVFQRNEKNKKPPAAPNPINE